MYKPKVGDRVKIIKGDPNCWNPIMDQFIDSIQTIVGIDSAGCCEFKDGGVAIRGKCDNNINSWYWRAEMGHMIPFTPEDRKVKVIKLKI